VTEIGSAGSPNSPPVTRSDPRLYGFLTCDYDPVRRIVPFERTAGEVMITLQF